MTREVPEPQFSKDDIVSLVRDAGKFLAWALSNGYTMARDDGEGVAATNFISALDHYATDLTGAQVANDTKEALWERGPNRVVRAHIAASNALLDEVIVDIAARDDLLERVRAGDQNEFYHIPYHASLPF